MLGSTQHHDAITGTAKQHVADDYSRRISEAMHNNSALYSEMISDKIGSLSGADSKYWRQCEATNGSYYDCTPMSEILFEGESIHVAI